LDLVARLTLHSLDAFVFGWLLALIAMGLSLIFGLLFIINVAHGALYMLGAVGAWFVADRLLHGPNGFWLAVVLVPVAIGLIGAVVERWILRPLLDRPVMTILSTFGLMLIFEHFVLSQVGASPRMVRYPIGGNIHLMGFQYSVYRLFIAGAAILVVAGLWAFLYHTRYGMWMRAVRQNKELALADGIPVDHVYTLTFALGVGLAALSGVLASPVVAVSHSMGMNVLIPSFILVIVGGMGDLKGALVVALLFQELEALGTLGLDPTYARAVALMAVTTLLFVRPYGLFVTRR
jgi:branched-chain amino acid transport system permease protein